MSFDTEVAIRILHIMNVFFVPFISVRNRSGIIAHEGLPNAKPLIVDFILLLPETNFRLKTNTDPK